MDIEDGKRLTSRNDPNTDLDRFAVGVAETIEAAAEAVFDDRWKATPIIAVSTRDGRAYPAAIILENLALEPVCESAVPDFKLKIADMVVAQAEDLRADAEKKYRK